jgi:hypothetical protein
MTGSTIASSLLHQRCSCHIINLIVKSGLKCTKEKLEDFCKAISCLYSFNECIAPFKSFCIEQCVHPPKFNLDIDVKWNATYLMLKNVVPRKHTFSVFISANYPTGGESLLTDDH